MGCRTAKNIGRQIKPVNQTAIGNHNSRLLQIRGHEAIFCKRLNALAHAGNYIL